MNTLQAQSPQVTQGQGFARAWGETALVTAASAIGTFIVVFVLLISAGIDMSLPLAYHGDTLLAVAGFKSVAEGNFPPTNRRLAAPFDRADWRGFPSYQWIDFAAFRLLSLFTGNSVVLLNWYWVLTIVAMAATGSYCFLRLGGSPILAVCLGFLYAMQPFPFVRNLGHLNLVAYLVPLLVTVCLEVALGRWEKPATKGFRDIPIFGWATVFLQGISFFYFSFFASLLLVAAAFFGSCSRRTVRPFIYTGWLLLVLVGATALGVSPTLVQWAGDGYNHAAVERHAAEAEVHGLKIRHLLTPVPTHPLSFMRNLSASITAEHPENTEATTTRLGLLAGAGFIGLMVFIVARLSGWQSGLDDGTVSACAALLFTAFLWCTVGGFGSVFATLVSSFMRAPDRIIVFVVFLILASYARLATAWLGQKGWPKTYPLQTALALVALTGISYADVHWILLQTPEERRQAVSDRDFVASIERSLGGDAGMVFQIPATLFPDDGPGPGKMDSVDPIRGYVNSDRLRWSWGTVLGTVQGAWSQRVAGLPPDQLLRELLGKGFRGLWIDTYGYADNPSANPAARIAAILKTTPTASSDGRFLFFTLDPRQLQQLTPVREFSPTKPAILATATVAGANSDCAVDLVNGVPLTPSTTINHDTSLDIVGWSAVTQEGIPPDEVYINIYSPKVNLFARAQTLMGRADVAQSFHKPSLVRSGFQLQGGPVPADTYAVAILQVSHKLEWKCKSEFHIVVR